ncbi:adenylyl-sulfate kinase [Terrabacter sp. 2YAF2]|uniref:adenylyl-sulfate kinase n=1 Tax=Terrabacter sp. 2YAF2 TaxID=3233026 RepID=UPI003F96981E
MTVVRAVPVRVMAPREIRDVELVLDGILPSGHVLGGRIVSAPRPSARPRGAVCAGLVVDPDLARLASAAGCLTLVDQEQTPLASLAMIRATPTAVGNDVGDVGDVGDEVLVTGTLTRERLRESGAARELAVDLTVSAGAYDGLIVFGRPALTSDEPRLTTFLREVRRSSPRARVLVAVPDQSVDTAGVPTLLMAELASRSVDRASAGAGGVHVDVATAPLAWRDPVSDPALVAALSAHVGARNVLVLSDDVGLDDAAARWRDVVGQLDDGGVHPAVLHPTDLEALSRWRPPRARRGLVVMFTGLSGSGKSTIARSLAARISQQTGRTVSLLDGDVVRQLLSSGLGFDHESRLLNVRRIGFVATEVARHGGLAICAPVAPYAQARDDVRTMVGEVGDFVLVHVNTPLQECERRDLKGLYAKARAGLIPNFTGISDPYEAPTNAEITIDTTAVSNAAAVERLFIYLAGGGWLETGTP